MTPMNIPWEIIEEILSDSLLDTLQLIPFLFVTYILMEWLEHRTGARVQKAIRKAGSAGPVVGSVLGAVPQCGFSAAAATLYAGRVITLGTLFAVFLSTSDEMLPIFLAEQVPLDVILKIVGSKIVVGMIMGFLVDGVWRLLRREPEKLKIHQLCEQDQCHCHDQCDTCSKNPELVYGHADDASLDHQTNHGTHDHSHDEDHPWSSILHSSLIHTVQVTFFVLVVTLILNSVLILVGSDVLGDFLGENPLLAIFGACLIALIPNCAVSVVIADMYVKGLLGAGAMFGGLLTTAGVGLLVLIRSNRTSAENVGIIVALYGFGVIWGLIIQGLGINFM